MLRAAGLLWQRFALGFGGKPDEAEAEDIDERDDRASFRVAAVEALHERAHLEGADGGEDAAGRLRRRLFVVDVDLRLDVGLSAGGKVIDGPDGWFVFDDGEYVDLGSLKGNKGSQNYAIPADVDLADLTSVAIWCDRFSVSFGAAELSPA